jgi:hypothetical protein
VQSIGQIIAKAQITNGGPVILLQPENEYSQAVPGVTFPDAVYMQYVEDQYRKAGIVVPLLSNDVYPQGHNAPTRPAAVDIYGHDGYPLGFDCANPYYWPDEALPTDWHVLHKEQSPTTPYSIIEFQGGSFDPWGGFGFEQCEILLNEQFQRVFYKNDFSFGVTIFNIYMTFGGTNWGNLGHPGSYTSYDYGAVITEDRLVTREKYSEAKLEANFLQASPAYYTATRNVNSSYSNNSALTVTALQSNLTQFLIVRHSAYNSLDSINYTLTINDTSVGKITIPISGQLTLNGRDSKIHIIDYDVGNYHLLYSTAEIFTWKQYNSKTVLVVYGVLGEMHELVVKISATSSQPQQHSGPNLHIRVTQNAYAILNWYTESEDRVVQVDDLYIYILERNSAYNYWVLDIPDPNATTGPFTKISTSSAILKAGYLIRNVSVSGDSMTIVGDLNASMPLQIIGGAPVDLKSLTFNRQTLRFQQDEAGVVTAMLTYSNATFNIPDLSTQTWYYIDALPEIQPGYSDAAWTACSKTYTSNSIHHLMTPTSLYAGDYGYHTGTLLYRGSFVANGNETILYLQTQGGYAFGHSVWLNTSFIGSFVGFDAAKVGNSTFTLPNLRVGSTYVISVVIDTMGLEQNWIVGSDKMKEPRGILDFFLSGHSKNEVTWVMTGNIGGEQYIDKTRGPLNEGGLFCERKGYHLPNPPVDSGEWSVITGGPMQGFRSAGIGWYVTSFNLDMPLDYDIPIAFQFTNSSSSELVSNSTASSTSTGSTVPAYRVQIYVNGWQFGKYVNNIGPQTKFPCPEGIWNYHGTNWVSVSLWSLEDDGASIGNLELVAGPVIRTGRGPVQLVESPAWSLRVGAY